MHDNVANRQHGATRRVEKVISCAPFATLSKQREDGGKRTEEDAGRSAVRVGDERLSSARAGATLTPQEASAHSPWHRRVRVSIDQARRYASCPFLQPHPLGAIT